MTALPWGFVILLPAALWICLGKGAWPRKIGGCSKELMLVFMLLFLAGNFFSFNFAFDGRNVFVNFGGYVMPLIFAVWLFFKIKKKEPLRHFVSAVFLTLIYLFRHNFDVLEAEELYPLVLAYPVFAGIMAAIFGGSYAGALFAVFAGGVLGQTLHTVFLGGTPFFRVWMFGTAQDLNQLLLAAALSQIFVFMVVKLKSRGRRMSLFSAPAGDGLTKDGQ
ncbi:MAG: hypothetical protein FWD39_04480 [Clostridiales bacterium]|nr:hypothetical protein [Clostridiales bacterium]